MNNLRTVGDFYKAGLVFVAGDIGIVSVETPFNEIGISNCNKGFCDAFGVHSFAWRANTDGWVPSFDGEVEYECRNGEKGVCQITMLGFSLLALNPCIKWRPHLDLTPQVAVPYASYGEILKPAFTQAMADAGEPIKNGQQFKRLDFDIGDNKVFYVGSHPIKPNLHIVLEIRAVGDYVGYYALPMNCICPIDTRTDKEKAVDAVMGEWPVADKATLEFAYDLWVKKC